METFEITVETALCARHRLRGVPADKGELHSHAWTIRASIRSRSLDKTGWVVDFEQASNALEEVVRPYKDRYLNETSPFDKVNPTREKLAKHFFEALSILVGRWNYPMSAYSPSAIHLHRIDIIEGTRTASYLVTR